MAIKFQLMLLHNAKFRPYSVEHSVPFILDHDTRLMASKKALKLGDELAQEAKNHLNKYQ